MKTIRTYLRDKADDKAVAEHLGVTRRRIESWRLGTRFPGSKKHMRALVLLAKSERVKVSLDLSVMEE